MRDWTTLIANPKLRIAGAVIGAGLVALLLWLLFRPAKGTDSTAPQAATPPSAAGSPAATAPAAAPASAGAPAPPPEPPKDTARIVFTTVPLTNATVTWGKTRLGVISPSQSLVIVRPRDSGPLDVMVRAPGYLPVQTRAHTFADTRIVVKLTKPDQTQTLVGYRAPIDAGVEGEIEEPEAPVAPSPFP